MHGNLNIHKFKNQSSNHIFATYLRKLNYLGKKAKYNPTTVMPKPYFSILF